MTAIADAIEGPDDKTRRLLGMTVASLSALLSPPSCFMTVFTAFVVRLARVVGEGGADHATFHGG